MRAIGEILRTRMVCLALIGVVLALSLFVLMPEDVEAYCPSTDVLSETFGKTCWECLFPMSLIGTTMFNLSEDSVRPAVGPGESALYPPQMCGCICYTPYLCVPGLPFGAFYPSHLIEVVRNPLCFPSLNGMTMGADPTFINRGLVDVSQDDPSLKMSYYHVHMIVFPLWAMLGTGLDVMCANAGSSGGPMDIAYLSEVDPSWNDDVVALLLFPEAVLFTNPIANAACAVDSVAASFGYPLDPLFWCAGSFGNIYPPSGYTSGSYSGQIKPAALVMTRVLAKLSRMGAETYWAADGSMICGDVPTFLLVKGQYKFQLLYPIASSTSNNVTSCCSPIGRTQLMWGLAKTYPVDGDDFVFLLWKLQRCCML